MTHIRYTAAACQTDLPNPVDRAQMRRSTDRMLSMIDSAVAGSAPFLPIRLVVFPEFAHAAPIFTSAGELLEKLAVPIPNEHTERLVEKAREHDIHIQSGSMLETDPKWPAHVFNTTCLVGPEGILARYRKVNTWIPYEVHTSPHDLEGYDEPLFPVVETPIGRLGCAICYDWLFPEVLRQLSANGAEVLIRVSAYIERKTRIGHQMLAHLRTDAYEVYRTPIYPPAHRRGARCVIRRKRALHRGSERARRAATAIRGASRAGHKGHDGLATKDAKVTKVFWVFLRDLRALRG